MLTNSFLKRVNIKWAGMTCKEFGRHHFHPHNRIKAEKNLKINNFSLIYQRIGVTRKTAALKTGETGEHRESQLTEGADAQSWRQYQ